MSLFDGISVAQLALSQLNVPINNYYASEIEKRTIEVTQHHFPETIQLGDIRNIRGSDLPEIDLLVGGSPCQDLSSLRKDRQGLDGEKSSLLFEALRLLDEIRPKYFLFENVGSMSKEDRKRFDQLLGVEGISINSNLVSAQNRNRIYWTNIPDVAIPKDRGILLKDIIEDGYVDRDKSNCILTKNAQHTTQGLRRYLKKSLGGVVYHDLEFAKYNKEYKLHLTDVRLESETVELFRLFTVKELERLQTLPEGYVGGVLKKTPAIKSIGNSFTLEVIKHILSFADLGRGRAQLGVG